MTKTLGYLNENYIKTIVTEYFTEACKQLTDYSA